MDERLAKLPFSGMAARGRALFISRRNHCMMRLFPFYCLRLFTCRKAAMLATVLALLLTLPPAARAWTPGLKEAAQAVARGTASMEQQMMVFLNNQEINLMGIKGTIHQDVYASCQSQFEPLNTKFASQAVEEAGFQTDFKQRSAQAKINPGTDTDVNFRAPGGKKIKLEDLKKIESNYQRIVRQHFEGQKLNVPEGPIRTDTDFLPDPSQMSPQEFRKCAEHINANGGTAYKSPEAVRAQMKLDGTSTTPVELDEAISFADEGKQLARHKLSEARALRQDAAAIRKANPGLAEKLEAQAQLYESQASKYVSRIEDVNNNLRRSHDLPELPKGTTTVDGRKVLGGLDKARDNIKHLNRGTQTATDASAVRALEEQLLQKATDQTIDTLAEIAKLDPSKANQARRAIAAELNTLPPARAGEALKRLEQTVGPNFTKSIANESRRLAQVAKPATRAVDKAGLSAVDRAVDKFGKIGVKALKVGIIAGGAYFMGKDGVYHALEQTEATDTELDFFYKVYKNAAWYGTGIGYAYEEAEKEELARYLREVEAGRDPGMTKHVLFTILKTPYLMGRDIAVGILYAPDALIEAITGAKEAEAKEQAAKEFLAAVRLAVLNKKETQQARDLAKEMGVHPEDEKAFLDCMCRACGGSLGGFFNPACTSDIGHGPCQCNGPLTIWKTPLPTGSSELQYKCFNSITQMHHSQAQAIFAKWRQRMRDENFNSAQKDVAAIKEHIQKGEFMEAADRFTGIKDLIDGAMVPGPGDGSSRNLSYELGTRITNGLLQQAQEHTADPALDKPLAQAVRKAEKAHKINPGNEEIKKRVERYKNWEKAWREVTSKEVPEIRRLIDKGLLKTASARFSQVQMGINQGRLPPRHKDPQMVALEELLRQKRRPEAYAVQISKPTPESPRPSIWQCRSADNCAMTKVGADTFITGEKLTFQADIAPRVPDIAYTWQVVAIPPSGPNCQSEAKDNRMSMRCPAVAKYLVSVRAQSADGSVLGHTSQQVVIAVKADEVARAGEKQQAYEAERQKATAQLKLKASQVEPGEVIKLEWSAQGNLTDGAWIGLIPSTTPHGKVSVNDEHDMSYQYIGKLRSGTMQFTAPTKQGEYDLRFNDPQSGKELASVTFWVRVNTAAATLNLAKSVYAPGEAISLDFTASGKYHSGSWIGLIPADTPHGKVPVNDAHDLAYHYLQGKTSGTLPFTAPKTEGRYDFRMNETGNQLELATVPFTVAVPREGAKLSLAKTIYAPGETMTFQFAASPLLSTGTWIGLIPADTPHGKTSINDSKDIAYHYLNGRSSGTLTFTAPSRPGQWDLRMSEPTNDREICSISFQVKKIEATSPGTSSTAKGKAVLPVTATKTETGKLNSENTPTKAYGSAAPLAGVWQVNLNSWTGTLTIGSDGTAVLRLPTTEEPLKDVGYRAETHEVTFTRPLPGKNQQQVYTGVVAGKTASGKFDCTISGKGYSWTMTRDSAKTPAKAKTTAEKKGATLPSGWKQISLGYLQFGIPASWQHKTASETWVKTLHLYWQGNFDNPDHGISCGVITNYNQAKAEMPGASSATIAGMTVYREIDGNSETLLFPPKAGTQGVVLMFFSGGGSALPKAEIISTLRAIP
jgi:anti-sigma28 factor (negative regulator of flagellin synthesis)